MAGFFSELRRRNVFRVAASYVVVGWLVVQVVSALSTLVRAFALWYPVMADARQLPKFKELVTDMNLVAYWRAYGWADACIPVGDNDFTCR